MINEYAEPIKQEEIDFPKRFASYVEKEYVNTFKRLNETFISKGYAVYVGEYGATNKNNLDDRVKWFGSLQTTPRSTRTWITSTYGWQTEKAAHWISPSVKSASTYKRSFALRPESPKSSGGATRCSTANYEETWHFSSERYRV